MDALKRAYAEMILNTAKEAASLVIASELKARRLEQDLISTKEEAARMLLRLKQMIDKKRKEALVTFINQRRKVDELECQLDEAEGIILELRAELNEAQEKLDLAKHRPLLSLKQSENGKMSYTAVKDNISGYEQLTEPQLSGPELLTDDGKHFRLDKRSPDVNSEYHVYSVDSQQNCSPIKEPDMSRNGCTQAVHKTEMNIVSEDLPLGENLYPLEDSTNVESMHNFSTVTLGSIISTVNTMQATLLKFKTEQFLTSTSLEKIKDSMELWMKSFSKDLADLSKDLSSSNMKSTLHSVQSHEFLSSKIDYVQSSLMLKLDSVDAKLATITAAILSLPAVIAKKKESGSDVPKESRRSTDDPSKKRSEPDSSRKDKGPVDKRPKH